MRFHDLSIVITGASQGIGRELAFAYSREGANVTIADVDEKSGKDVIVEIEKKGGKAQFVKADMRNAENIVSIIECASNAFETVDILINNAGIGKWKSPYELTLEEWDDVLNTNLRGSFLCTKEAAKIMRLNTRGGSIVNIASTRAEMSEPNSEAYAASKGGIVSLTHALAVSLGTDRIRVNCVSPGWIETKDYDTLRDIDHLQHPIGRVGKPSDVVKACFYLTDPDNDFVTGTNITVDGGMTHKMIYEP